MKDTRPVTRPTPIPEDLSLLGTFEFELRAARQGNSLRPVDATPPRVLDAGCGSGYALAWMRSRGWDATGMDASPAMAEEALRQGLPVEQKDLRLLSLPKESLDAIWCHRTFPCFTLEEAQRVLASCFQSLRPRTGLLFVSWVRLPGDEGREDAPKSEPWEEPGEAGTDAPPQTLHAFAESAFLSLLKQSGFAPRLRAERRENGRDWVSLFARRVG